MNESESFRLLLLEESAELRDLLGRLLHLQGLDVVTVATLEQALEILRVFRSNAILVEWMVGTSVDVEMIQSLRSATSKHPVRIVIHSRYPQPSPPPGADAYLLKPARVGELLSALGAPVKAAPEA